MREVFGWLASAALCLVLLSVTAPCFADEVVLKNGGLIRGKILEETDKEVVVRLADGNKLRLSRRKIKEVRKSETSDDGRAKPKPPAGDTSMNLRWGLKVGEELRYRSRSTRKFTVRGVTDRGSPKVKVEEGTIELTLKVISVGLKDYVLEFTITRSETRLRQGEDEDGAKGENDLVGKPMRLRMSKRGEVFEVISVGPAKVSAMPEDQQRDVELMVAEFLVRINTFCLLGTLPEGSAKPGETSWDEAAMAPVPHLGAMTFRVKNQLSMSRAGTAVISQSGDITTTGVKRRQLKSSKIRGELRFTDRLVTADQSVSLRLLVGAETGDLIFDMYVKTRVELLSGR